MKYQAIAQACKKGTKIPAGPLLTFTVSYTNPHRLVAAYEEITGMYIDGWEVYLDYCFIEED